jgi:hypothetical protein
MSPFCVAEVAGFPAMSQRFRHSGEFRYHGYAATFASCYRLG